MVDEFITAYYGRAEGQGFDFVYSVDNTPKNDAEFKLHNHDDLYEIYLFLSGETEFHIEGNIYRAHPHDLFIARPYEMHHNVFLSSARYERIILFIDLDFFKRYDCAALENFFLERRLGMECQIPAAIVDREMFPLFFKMNRYLQEGAPEIARCVLMEFLYLLNHIREPLTLPLVEDTRIQKVLLYINGHLTENLSLDLLADTFFINKYHLCRTFKAITGYTINQYINQKRLLAARELRRKGQSLTEASANAGFNSYAHFYRVYKKELGVNPRARE
ncbi:MAG: AraC family transcriptional regulator [Eubacteriales bacterium]|nr:AraC family transcriptional regulator [Eubacteriales bacterium]